MSNTSKATKPKTSKPASKSGVARVPPQVHAAFAKFEETKSALYLFMEKKENRKILDQYNMFRESYNTSLREVKALYKQHYAALGPTYGDFSVHMKRSIDTALLLELLPGIKELLEFEYKLPLAKYDELVGDDVIPDEIKDQIEHEVVHQIKGASEL